MNSKQTTTTTSTITTTTTSTTTTEMEKEEEVTMSHVAQTSSNKSSNASNDDHIVISEGECSDEMFESSQKPSSSSSTHSSHTIPCEKNNLILTSPNMNTNIDSPTLKGALILEASNNETSRYPPTNTSATTTPNTEDMAITILRKDICISKLQDNTSLPVAHSASLAVPSQCTTNSIKEYRRSSILPLQQQGKFNNTTIIAPPTTVYHHRPSLSPIPVSPSPSAPSTMLPQFIQTTQQPQIVRSSSFGNIYSHPTVIHHGNTQRVMTCTHPSPTFHYQNHLQPHQPHPTNGFYSVNHPEGAVFMSTATTANASTIGSSNIPKSHVQYSVNYLNTTCMPPSQPTPSIVISPESSHPSIIVPKRSSPPSPTSSSSSNSSHYHHQKHHLQIVSGSGGSSGSEEPASNDRKRRASTELLVSHSNSNSNLSDLPSQPHQPPEKKTKTNHLPTSSAVQTIYKHGNMVSSTKTPSVNTPYSRDLRGKKTIVARFQCPNNCEIQGTPIVSLDSSTHSIKISGVTLVYHAPTCSQLEKTVVMRGEDGSIEIRVPLSVEE